ncbi:MAG: TIGR00725 family protein [Candidatus Dormibacteraeota bacterium]|nr:TIGR00725 family protein [Candidatus Dormibacteraeota bacterium]
MPERPPLVAVCGTSDADAEQLEMAETVGQLLAERGALVVCGGLSGVMAGVARGARAAGGTCIGILPGDSADAANDDVTIAVPTGLGELRNAVIARSCVAMIAIGGGYGTLSEIGFALRLGKPVCGLRTWDIRRAGDDEPDPALHRVDTAREAVDWVLNTAV